MQISQFVPAEPGWKAIFDEPYGETSQSRIVGWALVGSGAKVEIVGMVVDPSQPSRLIAAPKATSPDGGSFARYGYSAAG